LVQAEAKYDTKRLLVISSQEICKASTAKLIGREHAQTSHIQSAEKRLNSNAKLVSFMRESSLAANGILRLKPTRSP
jgi:hypothetical protein